MYLFTLLFLKYLDEIYSKQLKLKKKMCLRNAYVQVSSLGVPWHPTILADQLTPSQTGGANYAHHITTGTPGFSDLPTALMYTYLHVKATIAHCMK